MEKFVGIYEIDTKNLDESLRIDESFDLICREFLIDEKRAKVYFVDAFMKDDILEEILKFLMKQKDIDYESFDASLFSKKYVTHTESSLENDVEGCTVSILSGKFCLLIDGFSEAIMIDCKSFPSRSLDEPESDRVLRGSHDGFCETLIKNAGLIRRRLRDSKLTIKLLKAGKRSNTDMFVCFVEDKVDRKSLDTLLRKIENIKVTTLSMGQQSIAECLTENQWYNPFPKIRYTERPDTVAATVSEGNIVLMVDNSPSAMIIETSIFDFLQDSNDYYFPSAIGTYLRYVRMSVFFLTMILTPIWYLLISNPSYIPHWLDFIKIEENVTMPIFCQLIIIELLIDALKIASLNTPSSLSSSFSLIGALVLGEFAVNAKWFCSEVVLYMAFVAIANFSQPSFELGYAFKFSRLFLLVLTHLFGIYGFVSGIVIVVSVVAKTKTVTGKSYLYPLYPFDKEALKSLFVRRNIVNSKMQLENEKNP